MTIADFYTLIRLSQGATLVSCNPDLVSRGLITPIPETSPPSFQTTAIGRAYIKGLCDLNCATGEWVTDAKAEVWVNTPIAELPHGKNSSEVAQLILMVPMLQSTELQQHAHKAYYAHGWMFAGHIGFGINANNVFCLCLKFVPFHTMQYDAALNHHGAT